MVLIHHVGVFDFSGFKRIDFCHGKSVARPILLELGVPLKICGDVHGQCAVKIRCRIPVEKVKLYLVPPRGEDTIACTVEEGHEPTCRMCKIVTTSEVLLGLCASFMSF